MIMKFDTSIILQINIVASQRVYITSMVNPGSNSLIVKFAMMCRQ